MINIGEIITKVGKKEQDFSELYKQMDEDYDLWNVKKVIFDTHPMAINITSNDPRSLFEKVQAYLIGSEPQFTVLPPENHPSPNAKEVANKEERLYHFALEQADIRLRRILQPKLLDSLAWFGLARAMIDVRILVYPDAKGNIIWDFLALDPRYVTFEIGRDGLAWVAYKTFRSSQSLRDEYRFEGTSSDAKGIEVLDYWDREINATIAISGGGETGNTLQDPIKHGLSEIPIIIRPVAMSPRICDNSGIKITSWGQSIFAPNRLSYRQVDELRTILATHAHTLAKAPTVFQSEAGNPPYTIDPKDIPYYAGAVMALPPGVKATRLPVPDIPHSLETAIGLGRGDIQRATYSDIEYGQLSFQLSGTALRMLKAEIDKVVGPRKQALVDTYTDMCHMIKKQIIEYKDSKGNKTGLTIPVKTVSQNSYTAYDMAPELLDNDFHIGADFVIQNAWEELEAYQLAQMAKQNRFMSDEGIMDNILKIQDTKAELEKLDLQDVEAMSPELKLLKAGDIYKRTGQERELAIVAQELQQILRQKQAATEQATMPQGAVPGQAPTPQQAVPGQEVR